MKWISTRGNATPHTASLAIAPGPTASRPSPDGLGSPSSAALRRRHAEFPGSCCMDTQARTRQPRESMDRQVPSESRWKSRVLLQRDDATSSIHGFGRRRHWLTRATPTTRADLLARRAANRVTPRAMISGDLYCRHRTKAVSRLTTASVLLSTFVVARGHALFLRDGKDGKSVLVGAGGTRSPASEAGHAGKR